MRAEQLFELERLVLQDLGDGRTRLTATSLVDSFEGRRRDLVLVARSLGGFVAPLVCTRVPVELMVLVAAMVPPPGESGGDWWANTGHERAVAAQRLSDDSPETLFTHDVPAEVLAWIEPPRHQTSTLFEEPWPLDEWQPVATRFPALPRRPLLPGGVAALRRQGATPDRAVRGPRRATPPTSASPERWPRPFSGAGPSDSRARRHRRRLTCRQRTVHPSSSRRCPGRRGPVP